MIWFTLLIPILTIIILLCFYRKDVNILEYSIVLVPSLLFILAMNYIFVTSRVQDTEYLGSYVVSIKYYEPWNEYIHKTCSYTTCTGYGKHRHCTTHYRDCSYIKNHREYWAMIDNNHNEIEISKSYYDYLQNSYQKPKVFVDMNRHYHSYDGDCYQTDWPKTIQTTKSITRENTYENKIQCSHSLFKIEDLNESEIKKWKVYNYPDIKDYDQKTLLGITLVDSIENKFKYINSVYATQFKIKTFVAVFKNMPLKSAYKQRSHWEGINKNEFLICVGTDSVTNKITWIKCFSWMKKPTLEKNIESLIDNQNLTFNDIANELLKTIPSQWKRRDFVDFDYLKIEITSNQLTILMILLLFYNIGISILVIKKDISFN